MDPEIIKIVYTGALFLGAFIGIMTLVFVYEKRRIEERKEREKLL